MTFNDGFSSSGEGLKTHHPGLLGDEESTTRHQNPPQESCKCRYFPEN